MIFITAGTTKFPFKRLEKIVLGLQQLYNRQIVFQNSVFTQTGYNKNVKLLNFVSPDQYRKFLESAELTVGHAGYATTIGFIRSKKAKPVLIPRLKKFNEHVNDHQLFFAEYLQARGVVRIVRSPEDVIRCLKNNKRNSKMIIRYIKRLETKRKNLLDYLEDNITDKMRNS